MWKLFSYRLIVSLFSTIAVGNVVGESENIQEQSVLPTYQKIENFSEIVTRDGYSAEDHVVITEDGYILSLNRISGSPMYPPSRGKPVALLLHGLIASSTYWILQGPQTDIAFLLVDEGFDVWLINVRGNVYSRSHVTMTPEDPRFWRFSWHEMGMFDLSASIDYILDVTGMKKIVLIGHSMGSSITFVLLSMRPAYNEKIELVVNFAPVTGFTPQFRGIPFEIAKKFGKDVLNVFRRLNIYELVPRTNITLEMFEMVCQRLEFLDFCSDVLAFFFGNMESNQLNVTTLPMLAKHYPAGTSVDVVDHYIQHLNREDFRLFDFGRKVNIARYRSRIPPKYPLARVTAPVLIYHALGDPFAKPSDIQYLERELVNVKVKMTRQVAQPGFSHMDFLFGIDVKDRVYVDLIDTLKFYRPRVEKLNEE